jgi:DNA polymerase alpha-associated DNA helicase A
MTRPRRHLCIIGDSETVGKGSKFLKQWMAFLEDKADLRYPMLETYTETLDENYENCNFD